MAFGLSAGAVSLIGGGLGLLSGGSKNGGAGASSSERTPWAPAAPYLQDNLKTNSDLQNFYQQNPFNSQQKTGLQNTLTDADHFRSSVAPGLMGFANGAMGSNYQRQTGGAPGSGAGYGGDRRTMTRPAAITPTNQGPFSTAPTGQAFGQIDWNAANPFSAQNKPAAPATPAAAAVPPEYKAMLDEWLLRQRQAQEDMYRGAGAAGGDGSGGGGGVGTAGNAGGDGGPGGVGGW